MTNIAISIFRYQALYAGATGQFDPEVEALHAGRSVETMPAPWF
jgi:hypothetical protein